MKAFQWLAILSVLCSSPLQAQWTGHSSSSDLNSIINRTGMIAIDGFGGPQIRLNSQGTYYGKIGNPSSQVWSLGWGDATTSFNQVLTWTATNNVGIGTPTPEYRLDVNGHARFATYADIGGQRNSNSALSGLNVYDPDGGTFTNIQFAQRGWGGSHAILFNAYKSNSVVNGDLRAVGNTKYSNDAGSFQSGAGMIHFGGNTGYMDFYISPNSTGQNTNIDWQTPILSLRRSGNVGIGTSDPDAKLTINGSLKLLDPTSWNLGFGMNGDPVRALSIDVVDSAIDSDPLELVYRRGTGVHIGRPGTPDKYLKVYGTAYAKEVNVTLSIPGPDYVFEKDYDLLPLSELEAYINQNKHLPEVPSAKEMEKDGLNLKVMNLLLLKKVEELTLHLIEQGKIIRSQNDRIIELEKNK